MLPDSALTVLVEGPGKPKRVAVGQRAKAGIQMVKARINQFHRDNQASKHVCHGAMRLNVGAKLVATKEHVSAKERIAFPLEIKILRQPADLVAALFHPFSKERLLPGAVFGAEIAGDEFAANGQSGVGRENHIGKSLPRCD